MLQRVYFTSYPRELAQLLKHSAQSRSALAAIQRCNFGSKDQRRGREQSHYKHFKSTFVNEKEDVDLKFVKSMTSKLRHASKNEHALFDFEQPSGKLERKNRSFSPHKDQSGKEMITGLLISREFRDYMLKHYQIIPQILNPKRIKMFIVETKSNPEYLGHISTWSEMTKAERREVIEQEEMPLEGFGIKQMIIAKPYIELYTDFVLRYFKDEYEASIQLSNLTDLTMPHEWFPEARKMTRDIHYHMGPTNSGKTKSAIEKLKLARNGIYCAPLRLLAYEISEVLLNNGVSCSLITGQEKQIQFDATHLACTIEMADMNRLYDVAVIDEIQLIEDSERGFAWTNALLGLQAREIHVCGDERAFRLIAKLSQQTGDKLFQHQYNRLSSLQVESQPIKSFSDFKAGDCIVAFSRKQLFQIKQALNNNINKIQGQEDLNHCSIIYGALPPDTKKTQAYMFNNRIGDIKFLVATDAIGMGLNLNISRVIFTTIEKAIKGRQAKLTAHEIKQIAGRAGRYTQDGFISAFKPYELQEIRQHIGINEQKKAPAEQNQQQAAEAVVDQIINTQEYSDSDGEKDSSPGFEEKTILQDQDEWEILNVLQPKPVREQPQNIKFNFSKNQRLIKNACLFPSYNLIEQFADDLMLQENTKQSLSRILKKFDSLAKIGRNFFLKDIKDFCTISDFLEGIQNMKLQTQFTFSMAPVKLTINQNKSKRRLTHLRNFAVQHCNFKKVVLPADYNLENEAFNQAKYDERDLEQLEEIHNILEVYLWLGQKYEKEFVEIDLCKLLQLKVCEIIDSILMNKELKSLFHHMESP